MLFAADFKKLCPAGLGYQYSASRQNFKEKPGHHGALLVPHSSDTTHGTCSCCFISFKSFWDVFCFHSAALSKLK